jgi:putative spermidine/putrescine transport system ATP-binding protein
VATVELDGVSKAYDGHPAVTRFSLSIASGESLALLGPSGCGKTTTLNIIAGFVEPDAGSVRIGARSMAGVPPYRRDTGMVFQSYALFPHLDVFGNLAFGLIMRGMPRLEIAERVRQVVDLVHLTGLERRYPRELSGGQQQRVALARALVIRPTVLLLDEPLSNLDAKLRQEMRVEIAELQRRLAMTMIFVTHDQEEALVIADRVAVMNRGRIEQIDRPEIVYRRPATPFVARFIGDANFWTGHVVVTHGGQASIETADGHRVVALDDRGSEAGAPVMAMVRPEKIHVGAGPTGLENVFTATVKGVSFLGAVTRLDVVIGEQPFAIAVHDASSVNSLVAGQSIRVGWRAVDCLLLEP